MSKLNWKPVISSALRNIAAAGFRIKSVNNGAGDNFFQPVDGISQATRVIDETDQSVVHVLHESTGEVIDALFVLGLNPEELVADWTIPSDKVNEEFATAVARFADNWAGVACPKGGDS